MEWLSLTPGFAMQIYAGLMAGSLVFIIGLHWEFLQSRRPSQRFKKLSPVILSLRRISGDLIGYESELEALRLNLRDIRIQGPDPFADIDDWEWRLQHLDAYSRDGRIREARNLFGKTPSIFVRLMRMLKKVN